MATPPGRGTADILSAETPRWRQLEELAHRLALHFGYTEMRTPAFEPTELFSAHLGDDSDIVEKELYTFRDRSGRSVTLRPEFTVPTIRAAIDHALPAQGQVKTYYLGEIWRYERPQSARMREGHQFGAEVLGAGTPAVDAELVDLAMQYLQSLGLTQLRLEVNSVGCKKCRPAYQQVLKEFLLGKDDVLCQDCERRKERNPLRVLDCRKDGCLTVTNTAPTVFNSLCPECRTHFFSFKEHLTLMGHAVNGSLRVVNTLGYYTRNVWQIVSPHLGAVNPVCTGGRFDELVSQMGGPVAPGVGFAVSLERVIAAMEKEALPPAAAPAPEVYLVGVGEEAERVMTRVMHQLRARGHRADRDYSGRGIKNQTKSAEKSGAAFIVLVGEEETRVSSVTVLDTGRGTQETVSASRLVESLELKLRRETRERDRDRDRERGRDRGREERGRRGESRGRRDDVSRRERREREDELERDEQEPTFEREERERGGGEGPRRGRGRLRRVEQGDDDGGARFGEWAATYSEAARNAPERPPRRDRLSETALTEGAGDDGGRMAWAEAQKGLLAPLEATPAAPAVGALVPLAAPIPVDLPAEMPTLAPRASAGSWVVEARDEAERDEHDMGGPLDDDALVDDEGDEGEDESTETLAAVGAADDEGGERRRRGGRRGGRRHGRRRSRK